MCKISDKLQLCTCAAGSIDKLRHYWVLHQLVKGKNTIVIGELVPPYFIDDVTDLQNKALLLNLLNNGNVFDAPVHPAKGDLLELSFLCGKTDYDRLYYGFKYTGTEWIEKEYDAFTWMQHHEEAAFGKVKNAIQK
jgi:hypothetical protein